MDASARPRLIRRVTSKTWDFEQPSIWEGGVQDFLASAPLKPLFNLVITSPPYNIGKKYERNRKSISQYFLEQRRVIKEIVPRVHPSGSICWQVGNYIHDGEIFPLDLEFHKIFRKLGLKLRNRIVWHFGHGLHNRRKFSGRYEVVLWYTKDDTYTFNLDSVRIPAKYPGKKHYKGNNKGKYSSHPLGKNPSDVWNIPNVKGNHIEKTIHPCQFPVGLAERLILALTNEGDVVFDPYAGVASAGVAALHHKRRFIGCEPMGDYTEIALARLNEVLKGQVNFRPHEREIYDHTQSKLSIPPQQFVVEGETDDGTRMAAA